MHLGQAWRIEFSYRSIYEYFWRSKGAYCHELVLLTARNIREYSYTEIRFSTPGSAPSCKLADTWCRSRGQPPTHARSNSSSFCCSMHTGSCMPVHACQFMHAACMRHACRFMHAGTCMPVHACRFMPAATDACVRTAFVYVL